MHESLFTQDSVKMKRLTEERTKLVLEKLTK